MSIVTSIEAIINLIKVNLKPAACVGSDQEGVSVTQQSQQLTPEEHLRVQYTQMSKLHVRIYQTPVTH